MPPQLALVLCTGFVLFLLQIDRKKAPKVSRALWIPTIWMLSIGSKPWGVWFNSAGAGADPDSGSELDRLFLVGLLCLGLLILARRKGNWSGALRKQTWLMLLIAYMLASIFWSDIPYISFKRWTRELVAVVMALLVLTESEPRQAMESVFRRTIYILIPFSLMLIKYYPEYGVQFGHFSGNQMWIGMTLQKNGLGRLCLISAFFIIWTLVRRWNGSDIPVRKYHTLAELFVLSLTFWLLKGPPNDYSATASVSLAAGLVTFLSLLWIKKHRFNLGVNTLTVMVALIIFLGALQPFIGGSSVTGLASDLGRDLTLTGRTEIWADLLPVAMRRSILGHGFGGFWTSTTKEIHHIGESHSGYLDAFLDLGLVGVLLISMFLLSSCRMAHRKLTHDFYWNALWICFLIMAAIHNITESSFNSLTSHLTAALLFLAVSSAGTNSHTREVPE
jgi:exopolysaccharide production protein ExoQ